MNVSLLLSQQVWLRRGWLACLLWPLTWLGRIWLLCTRLAYASGVRRPVRLPIPVVVVGNVLAGGTGKTPIVIALVNHFQAQGWRVGVIARGYQAKADTVQAVMPNSDPRWVGDEPLLVRRRCDVPVFVARQRAQAAQALLIAHPQTQVIISDDGLQHRQLHHDIALCVFDDRGLGNGWLLPAGPLREPWPRTLPPGVTQHLLHTGSLPFGPSLAVRRQLSDTARNGLGEELPLSHWRGQPVQALAAIAQPQAFFAALQRAGVDTRLCHTLPDHADLSHWQPAQDLPLLCTEKDAVKLWRHLPNAWAVPLICELPPALLSDLVSQVQALSLPHGQKTT